MLIQCTKTTPLACTKTTPLTFSPPKRTPCPCTKTTPHSNFKVYTKTAAPLPSLHLFATRYVRWHHFPPLMPISYSQTSEETTLRPLFRRGFIGGFSFPPLFATRYVRWRHMTLRRETTTTGLESFPSLCARYMGGVFYPGFSSCGRAGPGVEPGTF